jgi:hypothetical protein
MVSYTTTVGVIIGVYWLILGAGVAIVVVALMRRAADWVEHYLRSDSPAGVQPR